ncbi:MAG: hypothetical protein KKD39_09200 [Candidatus Altiarchaeota archaeon]|nr:hypothetical protein [Candidatus Altiarchaeota archaeon]
MAFSEASKQRLEDERTDLEGELGKYRQLVKDLLKSGESKLVKTQRQKQYHMKITELQGKLEHLGK